MGDQPLSAVIHIETPHTHDRNRDPVRKMDEARELARAIELEIVFEKIINVRKMDAGVLLSKGHLEDLVTMVKAQDIELVYINHPLTPIQQRNLEKTLDAKVIDRTGLILEIFGARAQTREGVLQVQHAALKYQKSRLVRSWTHLERQRGGKGFLGGPGETQIEADRRAIDEQIISLEVKIDQVRQTRALHRASRERSQTPVIALVGYTNAGKSTLFNRICDSDVFAKDMLFATLDPTMRQFVLPSGKDAILSDTVGFISDLPTELVAAFQATLEEVLYADMILHVRDASNPEHPQQDEDVRAVLAAVGVRYDNPDQPIIEIFNKIDVDGARELTVGFSHTSMISALTGEGVENMLAFVDKKLRPDFERVTIELAFNYGQARAWLFERGAVQEEDVTENGYKLTIEWNDEIKNTFGERFGPIVTD